MSTIPAHRKRRFVCVSARQRRCDRTSDIDLPPAVTDALRGVDDGITRWPTTLGTRLRTDRDDLCAAYFRSATGSSLLVDRLIHTDDHVLVVITEGDLVIESADIPSAVRQGGSAVVPPGSWRITEAPDADQVGYWLLFFSPALLVEAIGDDDQVRQLAARVAPAYQGVFVQQRLLEILHIWGQSNPADNIVQTIRAIAASMSAGFYMFLKEHFYKPRQALQNVVRLHWMDGARRLGRDWPGGTQEFGREFRLYHGTSARAWTARWRREQVKKERGHDAPGRCPTHS